MPFYTPTSSRLSTLIIFSKPKGELTPLELSCGRKGLEEVPFGGQLCSYPLARAGCGNTPKEGGSTPEEERVACHLPRT